MMNIMLQNNKKLILSLKLINLTLNKYLNQDFFYKTEITKHNKRIKLPYFSWIQHI